MASPTLALSIGNRSSPWKAYITFANVLGEVSHMANPDSGPGEMDSPSDGRGRITGCLCSLPQYHLKKKSLLINLYWFQRE